MHIGIKIMTLEKEPSTYSEARPPQGVDTSALDTEINKNPNKKRNAIIAAIAGGVLASSIAIASIAGANGGKSVENPTVPEAPTEPGTSEVEPAANNFTEEQYQEIYDNVPLIFADYPDAPEILSNLSQEDIQFVYDASQSQDDFSYSVIEQIIQANQ